MTVKELLSQFGGHERIVGLDRLGNAEVTEAWFPIGKEGDLYVNCGGDCLIGFTTNRIDRRPMYLVRNDRKGQNWDVERDPVKNGPRPSARLELVQSA